MSDESAVTGPASATGDLQPSKTRQQLIWWAKALSWLSLFWMTIEGTVAIVVGLASGSVALFGFGLDSAIEGMASVIVIWRFTGHRAHSDAAETRAQRLVAISFFLLAPVVATEAIRSLMAGDRPEATWIGMALTAGSLVIMPVLGVAKQRIGERLGSGATKGEGIQNMLCAYLAAGVLAGLVANAAVGWWWLDPVVALGVAIVAVIEGREAWRGEDCCSTPAFDFDQSDVSSTGCADDCCAAD